MKCEGLSIIYDICMFNYHVSDATEENENIPKLLRNNRIE